MPPVNSVVRVTGRNSGERSISRVTPFMESNVFAGHAELHLLLDVGQDLLQAVAIA